jgi:hypothetical protein
MHQQLWGYKVEWKSVSRGTGRKKVEYHCSRPLRSYESAQFPNPTHALRQRRVVVNDDTVNTFKYVLLLFSNIKYNSTEQSPS